MSRARNFDAIECFFSNGLWMPGRLIRLSDTVDKESATRFHDGLDVLASSPDPIFIRLNSPGGSVVDGMAIFDAVSNLSNHVTITVFGEAQSMGAIILQAADLRLMSPNATLMLHDGTATANDAHVRDFQRFSEWNTAIREKWHEIFAARTSKTKAYWRRKLAHDCYYTADQALKEGLIDGCVKRT